MAGPIAQLQLEDATAVGADMLAQAIATALGNSLLVIAQGQRGDGSRHAIALNDDDSIKTAPAAARQHWYSTAALASAASVNSTPDGADDWTRCTGYVVVKYANATDFNNGSFTLQIRQCRNTSFAAGTYYETAFTSAAPPAGTSYPANTKVIAFDVQRVGLYIQLVLINNGSSNFSAMSAEAMLVTVVR